MNNLQKFLATNNYQANSYKYIGKVKIIETNQGTIVYKEKTNNYDTYEYLKNRDFTNFPRYLNHKNDTYELLEYIKEKQVPKDQKLTDLIHLSSKLHHNTSYKKEIDTDEIKAIYEQITNQANYLTKYYQDLNNYLDQVTFMSPSQYLLITNLDIIYYLLNFIKIESTNWYNHLKNKKIIRYSLIHNNLTINHLLEGDKLYLISWDKAKQDIPTNDLIRLYEDNYYDLDLDYLIKEYEKINPLDYYEYLYFLIKLSIPKRLEFTKSTYNDCQKISNYLIYLQKIVNTIQKNVEKTKKV